MRDPMEALEAALHVHELHTPGATMVGADERHFRERIDSYADRHPSLLVRQLATLLRDAWRAPRGVDVPENDQQEGQR